jgi:hypothetical protein
MNRHSYLLLSVVSETNTSILKLLDPQDFHALFITGNCVSLGELYVYGKGSLV